MRAEGFVFGHVADEGIMESCAGELLRYRRTIDAEDILVFADIKKKHWSASDHFFSHQVFALVQPVMSHCCQHVISSWPVHMQLQVTSVSWKQ